MCDFSNVFFVVEAPSLKRYNFVHAFCFLLVFDRETYYEGAFLPSRCSGAIYTKYNETTNDFTHAADLLGVPLSCGFLFERDKNWFVPRESFVKSRPSLGASVVYRKAYEGTNIRPVRVSLNSL